MKLKDQNFEELVAGASTVMKEKRHRATKTILSYHHFWRRIKRFMDAEQIIFFTDEVGKAFLTYHFNNKGYESLNKCEKDLFRAVNILSEYWRTGSIHFVKQQTHFNGPLGEQMIDFLAHKKAQRLSYHTIEECEQHLSRFLKSLTEQGIDSLKSVTEVHILKFLKGIDSHVASQTHSTIKAIRTFFRYLYDRHLIDQDIALSIPKDGFKNQAKLPSTYSSYEINAMLDAIDRANAVGKRNYAICILAARLGLRASDIASLKFENLIWEDSNIVLNQYKTGRKLSLPLLAEIGNALIDYLKFSRPKSDDQHVFLVARSPFTRIYSSNITGIVHASLISAGISIAGRRHGPHSLRHSLAGILLEKGIILPVISEVLGHENTASTRFYLRIDLKSMRQCMLEVPAVSESFYEQKGGYFYA